MVHKCRGARIYFWGSKGREVLEEHTLVYHWAILSQMLVKNKIFFQKKSLKIVIVATFLKTCLKHVIMMIFHQLQLVWSTLQKLAHGEDDYLANTQKYMFWLHLVKLWARRGRKIIFYLCYFQAKKKEKNVTFHRLTITCIKVEKCIAVFLLSF